MAANGRLPQSQLLSIPGSGPYGAPQLRIDAAWAYRALDAYARKHYGVSLALHESSVVELIVTTIGKFWRRGLMVRTPLIQVNRITAGVSTSI